jgi:hypothetical protein
VTGPGTVAGFVVNQRVVVLRVTRFAGEVRAGKRADVAFATKMLPCI